MKCDLYLMISSSESPHLIFDRTKWCLLVDCSLSIGSISEELNAELTCATSSPSVRKLHLPAAELNRIISSIAATADSLVIHPGNTNTDRMVRVCLFCERKAAEDMHPPISMKNGGWGYYVIERGVDLPGSSCEKYQRVIELYLYKEGN
jgi:hypothetical protein